MIILTGPSSVNSASQFITVVLIFVFVLVITYFATKFVGNYQKLQGGCRNFEVIDSYRIDATKYLQIIRVADKYIVISVCKDNITKLAEVDENSLIMASDAKTGQLFNSESFASIISKAKNKSVSDNNGSDDVK